MLPRLHEYIVGVWIHRLLRWREADGERTVFFPQLAACIPSLKGLLKGEMHEKRLSKVMNFVTTSRLEKTIFRKFSFRNISCDYLSSRSSLFVVSEIRLNENF